MLKFNFIANEGANNNSQYKYEQSIKRKIRQMVPRWALLTLLEMISHWDKLIKLLKWLCLGKTLEQILIKQSYTKII